MLYELLQLLHTSSDKMYKLSRNFILQTFLCIFSDIFFVRVEESFIGHVSVV